MDLKNAFQLHLSVISRQTVKMVQMKSSAVFKFIFWHLNSIATSSLEEL